ncbi:MAG: hypothetical protein GEU90_06095 [Gemmatimonas sp.]|nr:hypothetical protein [Gemmatimonas sp.]
MESFKELSPLEQVRRERFVRARSRHLRQALFVQRHLIEARLEERRLDHLASLPGFGRLSEETRARVSWFYLRRRSTFLDRVALGVARRDDAAKAVAELRRALAAGEPS